MKIYVIRHATLNDMDVIMDMIDKGRELLATKTIERQSKTTLIIYNVVFNS